MAHAMDEEAGRAVHAAAHAAEKIAADLRGIVSSRQCVAQLRGRETRRLRKREDEGQRQVRVVQAGLVLKEAVVHVPEPSVRAGEFGRLGGRFGEWMRLCQGEMPKDESQGLL